MTRLFNFARSLPRAVLQELGGDTFPTFELDGLESGSPFHHRSRPSTFDVPLLVQAAHTNASGAASPSKMASRWRTIVAQTNKIPHSRARHYRAGTSELCPKSLSEPTTTSFNDTKRHTLLPTTFKWHRRAASIPFNIPFFRRNRSFQQSSRPDFLPPDVSSPLQAFTTLSDTETVCSIDLIDNVYEAEVNSPPATLRQIRKRVAVSDRRESKTSAAQEGVLLRRLFALHTVYVGRLSMKKRCLEVDDGTTYSSASITTAKAGSSGDFTNAVMFCVACHAEHAKVGQQSLPHSKSELLENETDSHLVTRHENFFSNPRKAPQPPSGAVQSTLPQTSATPSLPDQVDKRDVSPTLEGRTDLKEDTGEQARCSEALRVRFERLDPSRLWRANEEVVTTPTSLFPLPT